MSKTIHKSKRKPNFSNEKTRLVIKQLQLSENRLSRQHIQTIGNNDILYQLKNNGYIKESSKGIFSGTEKLKKHMSKLDGSSFGYSSSTKHADRIYQSLQTLPKQVFLKNQFKTGKELEEAYKQLSHTPSYQEKVNLLLSDYVKQQKELDLSHQYAIKESQSQLEQYQESFSYRYQSERLMRLISGIGERPIRTPDYEITLSQAEAKDYETSLRDFGTQTQNQLYIKASEKLHLLLEHSYEETISICIEIITNSYGSLEIEQHQNYERITGTPVLFLS